MGKSPTDVTGEDIAPTSQGQVIEKKVFVEVPVEKKVVIEKKVEAPPYPEFDEDVTYDLVKKVEQEREDFLVRRLNFSPMDMQKLEEIKNKFSQRYREIVPPQYQGELSIEQRRQVLEMDEEQEAEFKKAFGAERWDQFRKFQSEYNKQVFEKHHSEYGVFVPMDL